MEHEINILNKKKIETFSEFETEFLNAAKQLSSDGYVMAQCTNQFILKKIEKPENVQEILDMETLFKYGFDIRIFGKKGEGRFFRGSIDQLFRFRFVYDPEENEGFQNASNSAASYDYDNYCDYYEEEHFLDIDTKLSNEKEKKALAIGGGEYDLPIKHYLDAKIRIRNYLKYDKQTGMAAVSDWRCVEFIEGVHGKTCAEKNV